MPVAKDLQKGDCQNLRGRGGGGVADMGSITMKKILITISLEIDQLNYNYMAFEQSN